MKNGPVSQVLPELETDCLFQGYFIPNMAFLLSMLVRRWEGPHLPELFVITSKEQYSLTPLVLTLQCRPST
jgi:hypothetical protein